MIGNNRSENSIEEHLLEEISITVRFAQKYIGAVVLTFLSIFIFLVTFVPLIVKVDGVRNNMWAFIGPFIVIFIAETICALLFLIRAGIKSHELVQSCKKHLKSVSTIKEMELIRLASDLRNLFFICAVAFCFSAHVIGLITIFMINRIKKDLKMGYLMHHSVPKGKK